MPFLLAYIDVRTNRPQCYCVLRHVLAVPILLMRGIIICMRWVQIFPPSESRLVNSDFGRPAVCKEIGGRNLPFVVFLDTYLLDVVENRIKKKKKEGFTGTSKRLLGRLIHPNGTAQVSRFVRGTFSNFFSQQKRSHPELKNHIQVKTNTQ